MRSLEEEIGRMILYPKPQDTQNLIEVMLSLGFIRDYDQRGPNEGDIDTIRTAFIDEAKDKLKNS